MVLVTTISGAFLQVSAWARQLDSLSCRRSGMSTTLPLCVSAGSNEAPPSPRGWGFNFVRADRRSHFPNPPGRSEVRDALVRSIATVNISLLGAAGLQDCADSGMDCMDGFGAFVLLYVGGFTLALIWISVCLVGTADVVSVSRRIGVWRAVAFFFGIWLVPIAGLSAWLVFRRSR